MCARTYIYIYIYIHIKTHSISILYAVIWYHTIQVMYNTVITACEKGFRWELALSLLGEMRLQANYYSYYYYYYLYYYY